ncbi:alginate lyase 7 (plasmid) [Antarctobacter heliothermus]|uniref:Alginate lyase 7 n=2 Tax=Antarctobacter heliothermus TaxID=74033 RepID=A0A222EAF7_9RHOB|nr:alginate lyase 7 [Antarctobacter heliothermus]
MNTSHMVHMQQANALLDPSDATHVAVKNGAWSNPGTWADGIVPGRDAMVHIPDGISIVYDVKSSPALGTIRLDGDLTFTRAHSTEMRVETIVTTMGSHFDAGSMADPIPANVEINIVFRDTPINTSDDPDMLGHGLVAFGEVDIQGAAKESHLVIKQDVPAGATSMAVEGDLTNWTAGDTILVVGTKYLGEDNNGVLMTQDETRTIVKVEGDRIYFDKPLDYAHEGPTSMEADIYVGNLSRNVTFSSENPEGTRGHVMLHNSTPNPEDGSVNSVRYAAFEDLGRTDKSLETSATNPEGRYPLHLHQIGTGVDAPTNMLIGNAVIGSPGWGIVQHESRAMVNDNIVYDVTGAGIVSEWGNETGAWMRNLVSSVTGYDAEDKNGNGDQGAAYSNQSRIIVQQDNIAANSKLGWDFSGHEGFAEDDPDKAPNDGIHRKMFEREQMKFDADPFDVAIDHEEGVIADFTGNTVMTSTEAFRVYHRQFANHSDTLSVIRDFDIWGGKDGINLMNYGFNYEFIDSDWSGSGIAFTMWGKNSSAVMNDIRVSDFGLVWKAHGISHEAVLYDVETTNIGQMFDIAYDSDKGDTSYWTNYFAQFGINYQNPLPTVLSKEDADPDAGLTFTLGADADVTLAPGDNQVHVTGTVTDGLGTRVFYENIIGSISNQASSYEGASLKLVNYDTTWHRNFSLDEFLTVHGTWQKPDGAWVTPVVFWVTERLSGTQHPVIIELKLEGFDDSDLAPFALDAYPTPTIENADFDYGFDTTSVDAPDPVEPAIPGDQLLGDSAANRLEGSAGDDTLFGGAGNDTLSGGEGNDQFRGDAGDDVFIGGEGIDTVIFQGATDTIVNLTTMALQNTGHGMDRFVGIQNVTSGLGNDKLYGNGAANALTGRGGNDVLVGQGGNDTLIGNEGDDTIDGGTGADQIVGGSGNDVLRGEGGNDQLSGGTGMDFLTGGSDADTFVFASVGDAGIGATRDQILDFEKGVDQIDLTDMVPGTFEFRGTKAFSPSGNAELRLFETSNGSTIVQLDVNGDGTADAEIRVADVTGLTVNDFGL